MKQVSQSNMKEVFLPLLFQARGGKYPTGLVGIHTSRYIANFVAIKLYLFT